MPIDPVREAAVDTLIRIEESGAYLDQAVDRTLTRRGDRLSPRGRRFFTQLVYGTVRHRILSDHVLRPLLKQPLERLPLAIRVILEMGVFQALFCRQVTRPALVHTSVDLAKRKDHIGTSRLVNAVLRRVPDTLADIELPDSEQELPTFLHLRYSVPEWIVRKWIDDEGPEVASAIAQACAEEAPRTARVTTSRYSSEALIEALSKAEQPVVAHPTVPDAIVFLEGASPLRTKLFRNGAFYMQDAASMLAGHLVDPKPQSRVLDMCAAPGGKALHLAEKAGTETLVVAMDLAPRRMYRAIENAERLGVDSVAFLAADGVRAPFRRSFDAVLIDAPCSGLGTLRRHPDIKYRMQPGDIPRLAQQQRALLRSAVDLCTIGGCMVYSVCTFTPEETVAVIEDIQGDGRVAAEDGPAWMNPWKIAPGMYRIRPGQDGLDGYFLTRLRVCS